MSHKTKNSAGHPLTRFSQSAQRIHINRLASASNQGDQHSDEQQSSHSAMVSSGHKSDRGLTLGGLWHEIIAELMHLEATTAYWALQAASPADIESQELQYLIDSEYSMKISGEVATEELMVCLQCSHQYYACGTITVAPCEVCQNHYFSVVASH
jgi:hypothetical protein